MASHCLTFSFYVFALLLMVFADPKKVKMTKDAVEQLTKVFGIDKLPVHKVKKTPPEYMMDLYKSVTDGGGVATKPKPFNADIVRSFPDRIGPTEREQFFYNVSYIAPDEKILEAEFHVFRLRPRIKELFSKRPIGHIVQLAVYQILDPTNINSPNGLKLIARRRVSMRQPGWEIFKVTTTVEDWIAHDEKNFGFLISATSLLGTQVNNTAMRIAQRKEHHDRKQPILVVYTDNGQKKVVEEKAKVDFVPRTVTRKHVIAHQGSQILQILNGQARLGHQTHPNPNTDSDTRSRRKRSAAKYNYLMQRKKIPCAKHSLYVDFADIGWNSWIISPKGYNAYYCKGECSFPLGQSQKPTNHATVQSIVYALNIYDEDSGITKPCCVPNKLNAISLLYFDDDENVILKNYDDMTVVNCGCH